MKNTCGLCGIKENVTKSFIGIDFLYQIGCKHLQKYSNWFCTLCESTLNKANMLHERQKRIEHESNDIVLEIKTALQVRNTRKAIHANSLTIKDETEYQTPESVVGVFHGQQYNRKCCTEVKDVMIIKEESMESSEILNGEKMEEISAVSKSCTPNSARNGQFPCNFCGMLFQKKWRLNQHLRIHTGTNASKIHKCCFCSKIFEWNWNLKLHIEVHKNKTNPGKCGICDIIVGSFNTLKTHHIRKHGTEEQKDIIKSKKLDDEKWQRKTCESCGKTLSSVMALKRHIISQHGSLEKKNEMITKRLKEKEKRLTKEPWKCYFCGKPYIYLTQLRNHLQNHTNEKPFICQICKLSWKHLVNLKEHNLAKHGKEEDIAALKLKRRWMHATLKEFKCYFCFLTQKGLYRLVEHMAMVHTKETISKKCEKCHKVFKNEKNLHRHKASICSPTKKARKGYCNRLMKWKMRKLRTCYFCEKTFTKMEEHLRIHTEERPFRCAKCFNRFAREKIFDYHSIKVCKTETSKKKLAALNRQIAMERESRKKRYKLLKCERL